VAERRGGAALIERDHRALVRNAAERDDGAQIAHLGDGRLRKVRQVLISAVVGLFSGGTQRTALVMRASTSVKPVVRRAA
jgi:hypothetical protein